MRTGDRRTTAPERKKKSKLAERWGDGDEAKENMLRRGALQQLRI